MDLYITTTILPPRQRPNAKLSSLKSRRSKHIRPKKNSQKLESIFFSRGLDAKKWPLAAKMGPILERILLCSDIETFFYLANDTWRRRRRLLAADISTTLSSFMAKEVERLAPRHLSVRTVSFQRLEALLPRHHQMLLHH